MRAGRNTISTSDACTAIRCDVYGDIELAGILAYFTFCAFLLILKFKRGGLEYLKHPITIAILFHLGWILISGILAENPIIGIKFF